MNDERIEKVRAAVKVHACSPECIDVRHAFAALGSLERELEELRVMVESSTCMNCGEPIWPVAPDEFHVLGWTHYKPPRIGQELHTAAPVENSVR